MAEEPEPGRKQSLGGSKTSRGSSRHRNVAIVDALDFDQNRKKNHSADRSEPSSPQSLLRDTESLLSNVVDGIIQKDREKMKRQVRRYLSYGSAILSW
jgi:hypothetical protein